MLRGVASRRDQKGAKDGVKPANHLQVVAAFAAVPLPTRRPKNAAAIKITNDNLLQKP
jgi:hypothetical protein